MAVYPFFHIYLGCFISSTYLVPPPFLALSWFFSDIYFHYSDENFVCHFNIIVLDIYFEFDDDK